MLNKINYNNLINNGVSQKIQKIKK